MTALASEPAYTAQIESQRGEKWWGLFVGNSPAQPFEKPFKVNTEETFTDELRVPMLVSNTGRYVLSRYPMTIDFDGVNFTIGSNHEKVEVQRGGKNLREAYLVCCLKNFPPDGTLPPLELLTQPLYHTRIEFGMMETQAEVLACADRILAEGLPAGIILLSEGWCARNGSYDFDREYFSDPGALAGQLHQKGFKLMLTLTPFTGAFGRTYVQGIRDSLFLLDEKGLPLAEQTDNGYALCFNLSRREVVERLHEQIVRLQAYGVDGFLFDGRTLLPKLNAIAEAQTFLENWRKLGEGIALSEYLPGASIPLAPVVQGVPTDYAADREGLRATLCDVLTAGLAGFLYTHVSNGTLSGTEELFANDRLMLHLLQLGTWMPVSEVAFGPWRIHDENLREEAKKAILLRARLADYITGVVRESARTGEPLLRHMEYQFPREGFSDCNDQFMLGSRYLFAPALDDAPTRIVRLPRGIWVDADGKRFKGPLVTKVDTRGGKMIYFELSGK